MRLVSGGVAAENNLLDSGSRTTRLEVVIKRLENLRGNFVDRIYDDK